MKNLNSKFAFFCIGLPLFVIASCLAQEDVTIPSSNQEPQAKAAKSESDGFVELYNGRDLTGWTTQGNWLPQDDGILLIQPRENEKGWGRFGSYLWSERKYKDFELWVEVAYPEHGNSGIYFRVDDRDNPVQTGIEAQVFDSSAKKGPLNDHTLGGVIPARIAPTSNMAKPPGQWNQMVIRCVGDRLQVTVNGTEVADVKLQETTLKDRKSEGYIGLQDHGVPHNVRFRNIKIKEIQSAKEGEAAKVLFKREVLPIFEDRCIHCHGEDEQEGDFRLDTMAHIMRGGNSGDPAVVVGDDVSSHLVQLLLTDDEDHRMPLEDDPLSGNDIELIRKWIRVTEGWNEAIAEGKVRKSDHWSFQPIQKPDIPKTDHENPIDSFIESKLDSKRLKFSTEASQLRLIRRLYLVVHGVPPTPEQISDFTAGDMPKKWEPLVDRVLASPHYGERMAVNWLDLIRFSETDGFEINAERSGAWRYRDWVINAYNDDMPYDDFVKKQLAGDKDKDPIASAYLVAGPHNAVVEEDKKGQADNVQNEVSDFLNTTGTAFLGLTLGCARCHNHKFDPISQQDFYSVQAVFSGVNHGLGAIPTPPERLAELAKIKTEIANAEKKLALDDLPEAEKKAAIKVHQLLLKKEKKFTKPSTAYVGKFSPPKPTHRLSRGDTMSPRELVSPNTIAIIGDLGLPATASGSQRRAAFGNWVGSRENPLTARVMVNRIWQFHFGQGLVSTPNDFGLNGTSPSHPKLLDWLAAEFMDSGWSVKHIHKLILTSKTWKQDSRPNADALAQDSTTQLLWRFPPRRLEAEAIRDSILAATDKLDRSLGGPGFDGFEVKGAVRNYTPRKSFGPQDWRRMVYMTRVRKEVEAVFGVFDCPDGSQGTPRRTRSTTPLQALNLFNSEFVMQQAEFFAKRLESEDKDPNAIVAESYQICFGRKPSREEAALAIEMIEKVGLIQYCRVLLNSNEFVFVL